MRLSSTLSRLTALRASPHVHLLLALTLATSCRLLTACASGDSSPEEIQGPDESAGASGSSGSGQAGASGSSGSAQAGTSGSGGEQSAGAAGDGGNAGTGTAGDGGSAGESVSTEGVLCGDPLPGPALSLGIVEDDPGYESFVSSLDLSALPAQLDISGESAIVRAVVDFMLEREPAPTISPDEAKGPLGQAVLAAFATSPSYKLNFQTLRRGLHARYACDRGLPATLDGLKERFGDYTKWEGQTLSVSAPKCGPRRIWENHELGVYVAETLIDGHVRETEVIFRDLRSDGSLDFAVYTSDGELTNRSTFPTFGGDNVVSSAPYTCMACHIDVGTFKFNDLFPVGTGTCSELIGALRMRGSASLKTNALGRFSSAARFSPSSSYTLGDPRACSAATQPTSRARENPTRRQTMARCPHEQSLHQRRRGRQQHAPALRPPLAPRLSELHLGRRP